MSLLDRLERDERGYLLEPNDWSREVALAMAAEDDLELDDEHWEIIEFLREYYAEFQMAPAMRLLVKAIAVRLGSERADSRRLYRLFPDGPARQACRYAGLPRPVSCI